MRNTADVIRCIKPIAVWSQSISGGRAVNSSVLLHGRKVRVLFILLSLSLLISTYDKNTPNFFFVQVCSSFNGHMLHRDILLSAGLVSDNIPLFNTSQCTRDLYSRVGNMQVGFVIQFFLVVYVRKNNNFYRDLII
jgi:hypothetical protein